MKNETIPTAEEFFNEFCKKRTRVGQLNNIERLDIMVEFAKLHVEAALKAASEKATLLENGNLTYFDRYIVEEGNHYSETEIDVNKDSILNSYPLENIK